MPGLLAEALHVPAFADSDIEWLMRSRLDEILVELADPDRRAARQLSAELFPASARMSRPRKGTATASRGSTWRLCAALPCSQVACHDHRGHHGRPDPCFLRVTAYPVHAHTLPLRP